MFCESVTLAHAARPAVLAKAIASDDVVVHMAQHPRYRALLGELPVRHHDLESLSPEQFMQALAAGDPVYDKATLQRYVEEDLRLIDQVKPDMIIGDFRISLQVSASVSGVPYVTLSNAYWSEFCEQAFTVPDLPFTRLLGPVLGQGLFSAVRPLAFALHTRPMNSVRKQYGLPHLGYSLQRVYTQADFVLYADAAECFSMRSLPGHHRFVGPVIWSPAVAEPDWWSRLPPATDERPRVYVTLGSSGQARVLPRVLEALSRLPVTAVVATAQMPIPASLPDSIFCADFISGESAIAGASLVICNGGSPTSAQALSAGVPVLGIASNLDQFLNMQMVVAQGAGACLRAGHCDADSIEASVRTLLKDQVSRAGATRLARVFETYDSGAAVNRLLSEIAEGIPISTQLKSISP